MSIEKANFSEENEKPLIDTREVDALQDETKKNILHIEDKLIVHNAAKIFIEKTPQKLVTKESIIIEDRIFTYEEAATEVALCASKEGVDMATLLPSEAQYDKSGNLLCLIAQSVPEEDGRYKEFSYKIKQARKDGKPNPKATTNIDVTYWEDDMPVGGDIMAEYVNGYWKML